MSLIGLIMNVMLAGLLLAALMMGWRLNRRLQVLRDSHDGFEAAVRDLNVAAARAEQGLADLRAATDEATDLLSDRIEKGRKLAQVLERQTDRLERLVDNPPPMRPSASTSAASGSGLDAVTERRLGALLAAARDAKPERLFAPSELGEPRLAQRPMAPRRRTVEDDLFDDGDALDLTDVRSEFTRTDTRGVRR
jgi:ABC-type transporter Mla subunit MlaD